MTTKHNRRLAELPIMPSVRCARGYQHRVGHDQIWPYSYTTRAEIIVRGNRLRQDFNLLHRVGNTENKFAMIGMRVATLNWSNWDGTHLLHVKKNQHEFDRKAFGNQPDSPSDNSVMCWTSTINVKLTIKSLKKSRYDDIYELRPTHTSGMRRMSSRQRVCSSQIQKLGRTKLG